MESDNKRRAILISSRQTLVMSLILLMYFSFLYVNSEYWYLDYILIGVVQELVTIPMLLGTLVLFGLIIRNGLKSGISIDTQSKVSLVILLGLIVFFAVSFF